MLTRCPRECDEAGEKVGKIGRKGKGVVRVVESRVEIAQKGPTRDAREAVEVEDLCGVLY